MTSSDSAQPQENLIKPGNSNNHNVPLSRTLTGTTECSSSSQMTTTLHEIDSIISSSLEKEKAKQVHDNLNDADNNFNFYQKVEDGISTLERAYTLFNMNHVLGSFNGGKEATVIFYLMLLARERMGTKNTNSTTDGHCQDPGKSKLNFAYFQKQNEFPQIVSFIDTVEQQWSDSTTLTRYKGSWIDSIKECVHKAKESDGQSSNTYSNSLSNTGGPVCIVMGTRNTDPNAGKNPEIFEPSSAWLKDISFMRCNPLQRWEYSDVWRFLREFSIPYCSEMYDNGYTSIGTMKDTEKNKHLLDEKSGKYLPAYMLEDGSLERCGRI